MSDEQQQAPAYAIAVQYLRALSMDNTGAPDAFRADSKDNANESQNEIKIDIQSRPIENDPDHHEVQTLIEVISNNKDGKQRFIVRASYAAIILLKNIPEEDAKLLINVETPRLTFPYLRSIISSATHEAGYPALNLAPIDFMAVYRQREEQQSEADKEDKKKD